ncbi:hypothetical protein [Verrucomicrobium sp. BvORR034]|uniref:hypothetical protein n=1 Tax=Verrucomicrobium sp. BvORR034 TaxID=1396418 RepID=UPI000678FEDA|nr:hypothetical protein [Verrucomicrobium sp. BvORR034]
MFCQLFKRRVRAHAERLFHFLLPHGFSGEIFLCGSAFKPLLKKSLPVHDVDLWVRTAEDRMKLCQALIQRGASLVPDAQHPHALKFRLEGHLIEITCNAVHDGTLSDVVHTYELAVHGLGVHYKNGALIDTCVSPECWDAVWHRQVKVMPAYVCLLMMMKPACLIRTLHRMGQEAAELGFDVHVDEEHRLWEIYWHDYSEEERKAAMDLYFETTVCHKSQHHYHVVRRGTIGLVMTPAPAHAPAQAGASGKVQTRQLRPKVA